MCLVYVAMAMNLPDDVSLFVYVLRICCVGVKIVMAEELGNLIETLKLKWQDCESNHVEVFRYKLNVTKEKILDGNFKFFVQV